MPKAVVGSEKKQAVHVSHTASRSYEGIQALRFVASLLVVVTHSTFYASERLAASFPVWNAGATGVNIFFVISGFVMVVATSEIRKKDSAWKVFIVRRLIRIVPMYWLATSIKLIALLLIPAVVFHSKLSLSHVLASYFFIPTLNIDGEVKPLLAVGWTLYFEMFFYVLFAFALYLRSSIYLFLGIILTSVSILSLFRDESWPIWTMFLDSIVLQFFLGMLIAGWVEKKDKIEFGPMLPSILILAGLLLLLSPYGLSSFPYVFSTGLPATMIVLGTVLLEPHLHGRIPRGILTLGDASYVLYLFHPLIAPIVPTVLQRIAVENYTLSVLGSIGLALAVCMFLHIYVERFIMIGIKTMMSSRVR